MTQVRLPRVRDLRRLALIVVLALATTMVVPAVPADAMEVRTGGTTRLVDGLVSQNLEVRLSDGRRARGNILRFRTDHPDLDLRPRLAQGTAVGLMRMPSLAASELNRGAIAGVNGGYFLSRPLGVPNGLFVDRGRLIAGNSVSRSGNTANRANVGIHADGRLVMDRLAVRLWLDLPAFEGAEPVRINEINRQVRTVTDGTAPVSGELLLFDSRYGSRFTVPANSVLLVVEELRLGSSGRQTATVLQRRVPTSDTTHTVAEGTSALLAYGSRAVDLSPVAVGDTVGVRVNVTPVNDAPENWAELYGAIPGGGLLIRNGQVQSGVSMAAEGLNHAATRRARTAIAALPDGVTLLVTIDEGGGSSGLTLHELGRALRALGATDAVALDGGGSTTMTINAQTVNRPSDPNRGHSSALFVYAPLPDQPRDLIEACPTGQAPAAGFSDTRATVHREAIDCLAWWRVTSGVTSTTFVPAGSVTRAQMASFLARWLDDIAERGDGRVVPSDAPLPFRDVPPGDVHATAIARLAAAGIIRGRSDTIFDPTARVSRAETATLLRRSLEFTAGVPLPDARDAFLDDTDSVHEPSINQLAALGIIGGVGGFAFAPGDDVSRGAMASLIMRASDYLVEQEIVSSPS